MTDYKNETLIVYCGLSCGECPRHTGKIANLARDLRKELRQSKFDKIAEALSALSLKFLKDTMNVIKD